MESLNKIEIRGIIGRVNVKEVGDTKVANLSVATDYAYKSQDGGIVIETTWHNVVAWEGKEIPNLDQLEKGSFVHVCGRLRNRKYIAADGTERTVCDIVAKLVEPVTE